MAREFVQGKSTQELLEMSSNDISRLNESQLREVVGRLADTANKRTRSFGSDSSPAVRGVTEKFSTKGKNLNQLRQEYAREKTFLESQSSTRTGWKGVKVRTSEKLKEHDIEVKTDDFDKFWRSYQNVKDSGKIASKEEKYRVMAEIADQMRNNPDSDVNDISGMVLDELDEMYEDWITDEDDEFFDEFDDEVFLSMGSGSGTGSEGSVGIESDTGHLAERKAKSIKKEKT